MPAVMKARPLTVGPIVGHTTERSARLWGRGEFDASQYGIRRCFGVAHVLDSKGRVVDAGYFRMKPHFDCTGVIDFDGLQPSTSYVYRAGYFFADLEEDLLPKPADIDMSEASVGSFGTHAPAGSGKLSFVFGSCRYLLRLFGGAVFDDRGDKTFRSIREQVAAGTQTDFVLMLGDQIYADDLNVLAPDKTASQFHARYINSFTQPYIRDLMAHVPTYMTLDDHEIEDNWTQDEHSKKHTLFNLAMAAYTSYQLVHGPAYSPKGKDDLADTPLRRWYTFAVGPAKFFILDVRTERFAENKPREIISPEQMAALMAWLRADPKGLKFIGSSVPVFPDTRSRSKDKWSGFPEQRAALLDFIRDEGIERVVFLSGDVHCSFWAQLKHPGVPGFKASSLVSSAFFWPYPAGGESSFSREGLEGATGYRISSWGGFRSEDNFTRVTVDGQDLFVEVFDRKGRRLVKTTLTP